MGRGSVKGNASVELNKRAAYYDKLFRSLFRYSVTLENVRGDAPADWLIAALMTHGRFGYDKQTDAYWYIDDGSRVDRYGNPTTYKLTCDGHESRHNVDADAIDVFEANPECYAITDFIATQAKRIATIENAMNANILLSQSPIMARVKDRRQADGLLTIFDSLAVGAPLIVTSDAGEKKSVLDTIDAEQMNRPYIGDRLHELASEIIDETLCRLGIYTANTDKRERVQAAELGAEASTASDFLYMMIDHFNYCAERAGAPERMRANTQGDQIVDPINQIEGENNNATFGT